MEIWKDIPGYEGRYQVSNIGRIYSIGTKPEIKSRGRLFNGRKGKILTPRKSGIYGYLSVVLLGKGRSIHRLVASAFLGLDLNSFVNAKTSICVCHKDDNPLNNTVENLFLGTNKENNHDMWKKGNRIIKRGKEHPMYGKEGNMLGKFGKYHHRSKEVNQYTKDGSFVKTFYSIREAGRETNINFGDISKCCKGLLKSAGGYKWILG